MFYELEVSSGNQILQNHPFTISGNQIFANDAF
jgi:hypothetical protein